MSITSPYRVIPSPTGRGRYAVQLIDGERKVTVRDGLLTLESADWIAYLLAQCTERRDKPCGVCGSNWRVRNVGISACAICGR